METVKICNWKDRHKKNNTKETRLASCLQDFFDYRDSWTSQFRHSISILNSYYMEKEISLYVHNSTILQINRVLGGFSLSIFVGKIFVANSHECQPNVNVEARHLSKKLLLDLMVQPETRVYGCSKLDHLSLKIILTDRRIETS
ncbi:hypothetical protein SADUNF_Sadunf17G0123600 [Salix dunnii]|uniref:Uncharacterized protein n=1 Tax=Salix dunnii TaxID=1413687 RepID=A0A835J9C0_9ROSI|nr:hypothetical protein SADUNF_Sadunf17G0123600 [Salix dunnii]